MASTLTKEQQLSAANAQYRNWLNQQVAANGGYYPTINQINAYKAGILNTGLYPNLDMGTAPPPPGSDVNIAASQFFISGQGGDLQEDRGSGFTGQAIFSAGISDSTTLQQFTAAQDAYQSGIEQVYNTQGQELASQAQNAKAALAAAQARVNALQAQLDADSVVDPTITSSAQAQAASSAINQKLGQEISPSREAQLSAIDQQFNNFRSSGTVIQNAPPVSNNNTVRQAQLENINDSYTATSSGAGTNVTTQTPTIDTALQNRNRDRGSDVTEVNNVTSPTTSATGINEDNPQNGAVISGSEKDVYSDQQKNNTNGPGLGTSGNGSGVSDSDSGTSNQQSNSVSILKSGKAYGDEAINGGSSGGGKSNTGASSSRPNKLHNYANYTYRLNLYAVPVSTVNQIFASKTTPTNQEILQGSVWICSDSGKGGNTRSDLFPVDLTIDNLELDTIVNATNSRSRATDVIRFKFDIIEPYTVNFLGRLMKLSANINANGNWSTMFFVLKIEFMGYTDSGMPIVPNGDGQTIPNTTKFIPFTMLSMKFNVTSSGGKYNIEAVPVNALALTALDNQIPFHVEVSGLTVEDIFNGGLESSTATTSTSTGGSAREQNTNTTVTKNTVNGNNTTVTKGLAEALKKNEEQKKFQQTQQFANEYKFEFLDGLGTKQVIDIEKYFKIQNVPGTSGKDAKEIEQGRAGSLVADIGKSVYRANPGTRITDFINSILQVSTYMTEQYTTNPAESGQPLKTWKITPVIEFGDIDEKTNFYTRKVTYVVREYITYGQDAQHFGQQQVPKSRVVKTYNYIYSGQNQDVLDSKIEYNMAFFELKNGVPYNYITADGLTPGAPQPFQENAKTKDKRVFQPRFQYTNGLAGQQFLGAASIDLKSIRVQELMEKLFDNRGDLIQLELTIVGDPDWISQDYSLMHPSAVGSDSFLNNGSVNYSSAVYFNFNFFTPNNDYNATTGLFDDKNNYSEFSGLYQVISVKSNFSGGKFTQGLRSIRVRNQENLQTTTIRSDTVNPNAPTSSNNASNLKAEKATNTVIVPNDPRLNLAAGNNIAKPISQQTFVATDPRVGIVQPLNTWTEDTAINNYFMGTN